MEAIASLKTFFKEVIIAHTSHMLGVLVGIFYWNSLLRVLNGVLNVLILFKLFKI